MLMQPISLACLVPLVSKILYSTCSVHAEENEHVVREALASVEAKGVFKLAPRSMVLSEWSRRGISKELGSAGTVKTVDCTLGSGC